jgi:hypothetical protein
VIREEKKEWAEIRLLDIVQSENSLAWVHAGKDRITATSVPVKVADPVLI